MGLALGGCATVLSGTNVDYAVKTDPAGAQVKFTTGATCTSPCLIALKRKSDQRVDIAIAGYKPTYVLVQSKLAGGSFGNILLGGGVGAVVDGTNGASNRLYPRPLVVRLAAEELPCNSWHVDVNIVPACPRTAKREILTGNWTR